MISLLFISLASFLNSVMDICDFKYPISIFQNKNPMFWNHSVSWNQKKFLGIEVLDSWHIAKNLMLLCFMGFGYFFEGGLPTIFFALLLWFIVFEISFNKLLISKTQPK